MVLSITHVEMGGGPPSKRAIARMQLDVINELLNLAAQEKPVFPSLENRDIVQLLEAHNLGSYLKENHIQRNKSGEIVDPWNRPYIFEKSEEKVFARSPGSSL